MLAVSHINLPAYADHGLGLASIDYRLLTVDLPPVAAAAFVHPWFVALGAALIAIPIIIHLLNRRRYRTVSWAAMEFLLQAMRRNRRRMKFESWLLLAMRCLLIFLLAAALARPMGCSDSTLASLAGRNAGLHVVVLDDSYSMTYRYDRGEAGTHFEHAKELASRLISRLDGGSEQVAVLTAASPADALVAAPTYDLSAAVSAIEGASVSFAGTDLAGALEEAITLADEADPNQPKTLHLLTDATVPAFRGSQAQRLAELGPELAERYTVILHDLSVPRQANRAVVDLSPGKALVRAGFDNDFEATLRGFGPAGEALLRWQVDGADIEGGQAVTPDLQTPPIVNARPQFAGGTHTLSATMVPNDELPADDSRTLVVNVARDLPILVVEGQRGLGSLEGSAAFLSLALAPPTSDADNPSRQTASYLSPQVVSDLELPGMRLDPYRAVILAGVGSLSDATAADLERFVRAGGTLMIWMGEPVSADNYNDTLLQRSLLPGPLVRRVGVTGDERGYQFDFDPSNVHPFLAAFRNAENSGLGTAQILTYWQIDLPEQSNADIVLRYQPRQNQQNNAAQGDPAILAHTLGGGRVVTITTAAADADWTLLPQKTNYVSFIHELVGNSVGGGSRWMNLTVGDRLVVPPSEAVSATPEFVDPEQDVVPISRETREDGLIVWRTEPLTRPGLYQLTIGDRTVPVAVNIPAEESDIRPLDAANLRAALGDADVAILGDELPADNVLAEEDRADFGWSLLLAVLILAAAECFMAMRFGRMRR